VLNVTDGGRGSAAVGAGAGASLHSCPQAKQTFPSATRPQLGQRTKDMRALSSEPADRAATTASNPIVASRVRLSQPAPRQRHPSRRAAEWVETFRS
jgi:hypothetical protein